MDTDNSCCGTHESACCWITTADSCGIVCASLVWLSILYAAAVTLVVVVDGELAYYNAIIILFLVFMALWSHARTMFGDPGAVPRKAHPLPKDAEAIISMCGRCDGYKPPGSHHDRTSNRCISRMDHFCPWMNNPIGAKNQKNFFLFLIYTDLAAIYMYIVLCLHLIDCSQFNCFTGVGLNLVRVLIFILIFGILFTSSMIINQVYNLATGLGTIDRMKHVEEGIPVPFEHVFGSWWLAYFIPIDPYFADPEAVYHYRLGQENYCSK